MEIACWEIQFVCCVDAGRDLRNLKMIIHSIEKVSLAVEHHLAWALLIDTFGIRKLCYWVSEAYGCQVRLEMVLLPQVTLKGAKCLKLCSLIIVGLKACLCFSENLQTTSPKKLISTLHPNNSHDLNVS